jgi:spore coat polysaccharide biosynthesis predicted glycosyltransferase SpsG
MGHLVRCLALAQELRRQTDERIVFDIPHEHGIARHQVVAASFGFWEGEPVRVCVQDYAGQERRAFAPASDHVMLVDETQGAEGPFRFGIFGKGNHNASAGLEYAIVREQFVQARARGRRLRCGVPRVLLSFGGADPADIVEAATHSLAETPYELTAVLGPAYPRFARYIERWGNRVTVHRSQAFLSSKMAEHMASADLLLCSGGMTPLEAACVGTPAIVIAQNDLEHARMLEWQHHWTGYYLGLWHTVRYVDVQQATVKLLADPETLDEMSRRGQALVDGRGAARVARAILHMARANSAA